MLYKNTTVKVRSLDGDTDFFDNVAGVLPGDTLAPYLFIICLNNVLRTSIELMKENGITLEADDTSHKLLRTRTTLMTHTALLVNTPAMAESLLHSLEKAAGSIGLDVNANKIENMCFNQNQARDISTLTSGSLNKFTYIGSSIASTENINKWLSKTWSTIDRLSVIWNQTCLIK